MTLECDVLVRTKNSAETLPLVLAALHSQKNIRFNLYVCDSGSTDDTLSFLKDYEHQFLKVESSNYYPGEVLNTMISKSNLENIVFLNSDSILLSPYSIFYLLKSLNNETKIAGVYGRQMAHPEHSVWVQRDYQQSFPSFNPPARWMHFSAPIAALKRSVWSKRPFYTDSWGSEDTEWAVWAKSVGFQVIYEPRALSLHSHEYTSKEIYRRKFIEGEADVFIFNKRHNFVSICIGSVKEVLGDFLWALKNRKCRGLFKSTYIHFFESWGYLAGLKWGQARKKRGDTSREVAQKLVLKNYD